MNYILDGHEVVEEPDLMKWAEWFEKAERHVNRETIDGVDISTVFLAMDHSFGHGPPMLFETMVFGGKLDEDQDRCSTWEQAEKMHKDMCERVRNEK